MELAFNQLGRPRTLKTNFFVNNEYNRAETMRHVIHKKFKRQFIWKIECLVPVKASEKNNIHFVYFGPLFFFMFGIFLIKIKYEKF